MLPKIEMEGRLTADPELQFLPSGVALCKLRLAANDRKRNQQTGQYEDGDPIFLNVTCWRDMAENVAESLQRGDQVTASGRLRMREYEPNDAPGTRRTVYEIDADNVFVGLRFSRVSINRTQRTQAAPGGYPGQGSDDPWAAAATRGQANAETGQQYRQQPAQQPAQQQPQWGGQPPTQDPPAWASPHQQQYDTPPY